MPSVRKGPFYKHGSTLIPAWISAPLFCLEWNHLPISTLQCCNCWMLLISYFTGCVIIYPCWGWIWSVLIKGATRLNRHRKNKKPLLVIRQSILYVYSITSHKWSYYHQLDGCNFHLIFNASNIEWGVNQFLHWHITVMYHTDTNAMLIISFGLRVNPSLNMWWDWYEYLIHAHAL